MGSESLFPTGWFEEGKTGGLTKRELFAAMAMQGMVAGLTDFRRDDPALEAAGIIVNRPRDVSEIAVVYADALIDALACDRTEGRP